MNIKQVIIVRRDLQMRKGKIAAQVAHASMDFIFKKNKSNKLDTLDVTFNSIETAWLESGRTKIVCYVDDETHLDEIINASLKSKIQTSKIIDAGRTEFHGEPTVTVAALGPEKSSKLDKITGALKLL